MYDLNTKFNKFYTNDVVLPNEDQVNLREKKDLNIDRLKDGLKEHNEEKKTSYSVVDTVEQGSMAMSTITQNDENEYDIDVAIIFEKSNLPDGTTATKNIIEDALKRKCTQFKTEPEALTNAIRVEYADGYHVDFAVYRRFINTSNEYEYEHCGSEWRSRDPRAITNWFNKKNTAANGKIREVVRLLKMFCKSRSGWLMPGGLIQSVLVEECLQSKDKIQETFYYTIEAIRDRLTTNKAVNNPVDTTVSLLLTAKDDQKVKNLGDRLTTYLKKLDVLFKTDCNDTKAISAWNDFFKHSYWEELITQTNENSSFVKSSLLHYKVDIEAQVEWKPGIKIPFKTLGGKIPKKRKIHFVAVPNFTDYTAITWEIINTGDECGADKGHIRTGISNIENTAYRGKHSVECRVYRNGELMCSNKIDVFIK